MGDSERASDDDEATHLDGVDSGAGCAEIWEHLSEGRENPDRANRDAAEPEE